MSGSCAAARFSPKRYVPSAVELFETDEDLWFGDATLAAHIRRTGVEYLYSFEDDFDALDWDTRPEAAGNLFN